jgi:hypothetical protein
MMVGGIGKGGNSIDEVNCLFEVGMVVKALASSVSCNVRSMRRSSILLMKSGLGPVRLTFSDPARLCRLSATPQGEGVCGDIFCDAGTGGDVGSVP